MRFTWFALLLLSTVTLAAAQPITGTYALHHDDMLMDQGGPSLFGTLPEGPSIEIAEASQIYIFNSTGIHSVAVPLPVYEGGEQASIEDVMFTVRFSYVNTDDRTWSFRVEWSGGGDLLVYVSVEGQINIEVKVWAFRPGSVPTAPIDFGQVKALYD